ncbi:Asp-tRNA(Asn)/Glu-tRNA(Gln) amidotransferase subunit GatB [Patescibacteria group bacterium]|nr:Asp-tRNA(Asn)/Glu-tRNA(Gln) amidotransferase subunit GatB [Patescibacteria group bacterium]
MTTQMTKQPSKYQLVCGLEIHAELKTKSKMFCGCQNDPFGAQQPNIYTCPVCLGMPGGLPVANKQAIERTIMLGLALNCRISLFSKFDRKHYFYPDLPKGYQISQYDQPFCYNGWVETSQGRVAITRVHLEEDTGKLLHKTIEGKKVSLVDFNRGGVPLVEIVTEPDIKSAEQAKELAQTLRQMIRYLNIGDCNMEQGGMRLEANVSLSADGQLPDYKTEVKNINSFRFLEQAINFEEVRQAKLLDQGQAPVQETRGFDAVKGETFSQRTKETTADYRYFPEPDIPPLRFTPIQAEHLQASLPELPNQVLARWQKEFGLDPQLIHRLVISISQTQLLDKVWQKAQEKQVALNKLAVWIINHQKIITPQITADQVMAGFLNQTQTEQVDETKLTQVINQVLADHPAEVKRYLAGEKKLLGFFIGQVKTLVVSGADIAQVSQAISRTLNN